ncbi:hypothetical protein TNCV_138551 [Trichonephila clavipes]|nr:hypothetical protein TNCV_138551 [Trichonephila clavipes]
MVGIEVGDIVIRGTTEPLHYASQTGPTPSTLAWCGIRFHCSTPLLRIAGTLNRQRCISKVLESVVLPNIQ